MISKEYKPLYALVLCGGFSKRMQTDKFLITYHDNIPQWLYLHNLLKPLVDKVFISCRNDQVGHFEGYPVIEDKIEGSSPSVGLLSAHKTHPEAAWLVIACDLPLLTDQSLKLLINERDSIKYATSFISPENDLPEPLIAIWEPKGLQALKENFESGLNCPRKTLINNNIKLIYNDLPHEQLNANTPEEMEQVLKSGR